MHKKSDYYTSPDNYRDIDGNMKTFNYIDHDSKTKVSMSTDTSSFNEKEYRKDLLERILDIEAVYCPIEFQDFVVRGDVENITWNEIMLSDEGILIDKLRTLCVILENRINK